MTPVMMPFANGKGGVGKRQQLLSQFTPLRCNKLQPGGMSEQSLNRRFTRQPLRGKRWGRRALPRRRTFVAHA